MDNKKHKKIWIVLSYLDNNKPVYATTNRKNAVNYVKQVYNVIKLVQKDNRFYNATSYNGKKSTLHYQLQALDLLV